MLDFIVEAISAFAEWVWEIITSLFLYVENLVNAIFDTVLVMPEYVFSQLCEGIVEFFNSFPVPDFVSSAGGAFQSVPASIIFYGNALQIGPGIAMVLSAYLLRFILRRVPIIG